MASSNSTMSFNAGSIGALIIILIDDGNLQYLWPQIVQIAGGTGSRQVIQELISQYGDNIYHETTSALESNTGHFVKRHATSIARKITSDCIRRSDSFFTMNTSDSWQERGEVVEEESLPTTDLEYFSPDIRLVEAFLFESEAYLALQASVQSYVRDNSTLVSTDGRLANPLRLGLQLAVAKLGYAKPPQPALGMTRLKFTCVSQPLPSQVLSDIARVNNTSFQESMLATHLR